jgi:hypothetical protein
VPYSTCFLTLQKHKYPGNFSQSFEQPIVDHIDDRHDYIARLASQGVAPKAVDYKFPHEVINRNEEKRQG